MLLNATTSIQSEKLRERLKPRSSQATSVIDTDCSYPIVPQHHDFGPFRGLCFLFLCHQSSIALIFQSACPLSCLQISPLLNICLTWQDASVAWQLLFTFVHKRGSGTLSPRSILGTNLSQKNVTICFVPCTSALSSKGCWREDISSWEVSSQVFQVACRLGCLTSGLWFCMKRVATL